MNDELKNKAIEMRKNGVSIIKIAKELGVAKSTISVWTRGVTLTEDQKSLLLHREISTERSSAHSNIFRIRRQQYQDKGKKKIKENDPLYIAGCMLYWGEGTKDVNICQLTNSELPMLALFKKFLTTHFCVTTEILIVKINAYTDLHSEEEIKKFWLNGLNLPLSALKKCYFNRKPISSKEVASKLEYGTCSLSVYNTEVVQEIFGAIQEFGSFRNEKWLNKNKA